MPALQANFRHHAFGPNVKQSDLTVIAATNFDGEFDIVLHADGVSEDSAV